MIRLGETQELMVAKQVDFGVYLAEENKGDVKVLLPKKQVPPETMPGDKLTVFIYKDSQDRIIATRNVPKIQMGNVAALQVVSVQKIGAFLDWGLEKDLFLPYKEQSAKVQVEDKVLVRLYIDKSSRLCASMCELYEMLQKDAPYTISDIVEGRIYEFSSNFGTFVAVDDCYSALIPHHEDTSFLRLGEVVKARVTEVKPDGKLTLTLREKAFVQIEKDALTILAVLDSHNGELPFNDKASPEQIMQETKLSKGAFKRAVGRLYKERKIEITDKNIRRI